MQRRVGCEKLKVEEVIMSKNLSRGTCGTTGNGSESDRVFISQSARSSFALFRLLPLLTRWLRIAISDSKFVFKLKKMLRINDRQHNIIYYYCYSYNAILKKYTSRLWAQTLTYNYMTIMTWLKNLRMEDRSPLVDALKYKWVCGAIESAENDGNHMRKEYIWKRVMEA